MTDVQSSFELLNSAILLAVDHDKSRIEPSPGSEGAFKTNSWRYMRVVEIAAPTSMQNTHMACSRYRRDLLCNIHIY